MNLPQKLITFATLLITVCAFPDNHNPNLDFELIRGGPQVVQPKFINMTATVHSGTTRPPVVIKTPPPPPENSKTFAFDGKTWTEVKKNSPTPPEDSLLWNQKNDKYL